MKTLLLRLLLLVLLCANVSKWYVSNGAGFRLYYHHLALLAWLALGLPYLLGVRRLQVPWGLKLLLLFVGLRVAAVIQAVPVLLPSWHSPEAITYFKAVAVSGLEAFGIIVILLFATRLNPGERHQALRGFLAVICVCLAYTFLQAWAIYVHRVDLDVLIAHRLPFWDRESPGIVRQVFGLASGTYYRLTGLTGDPNLNGTVFLVALPFVFYRAVHQRSLRLGALVVILAFAVLLTVSNTAILLALPILILMCLRHWAHTRWLVLAATAVAILAASFLLQRHGAAIEETINFKLATRDGTASSHFAIARQALEVWWRHPFGVGANSYPLYSAEYSAHNSYLQLLVEQGPAGLLVLLAWAGHCLNVCWRSRGGLSFATALALFGLLCASLGHDLLTRFEFQLPLNLFVAFVLLNERDRREPGGTGGPSGKTGGPSPTPLTQASGPLTT